MDVTAAVARPSRTPAHRHYRIDIQGLRGIGVLSVVAYHVGLPLPGGFFAVDSFFVISGFVIAGLLLRDLEKTCGFSARTFYMRRARRLLPGAGLLIVCTVLLSSVLLTPLGALQRVTGEAAMAASTFTANLYFMVTTGGYFQPAATSNPFLHMWSLSVEEQFYFVLPWVLLLGWLLFPHRRVRALGAVAVVAWALSMAANLAISYRWLPGSLPMQDLLVADGGVRALAVAFFSPMTRSWEFLTGVLILLAARRVVLPERIAPALSWVGLAMLIGSFFLLNEDRPLPGMTALIPVTGTALVLLAGCSVPLKALSQRHLVGLGNVSYSWYLWHWPLIIFAVAWFHSMLAALVAAVVSLLVALLAYHYVEKPIRDRRRIASERGMALVAVACIIIPVIAGYLLVRAWQHDWWNPQVATLRAHVEPAHLDERGGCNGAEGVSPDQVCSFTVPDAKGTVLLIGDSTAGMFAEAARAATQNLGYNLEVAARSACPVEVGFPNTADSCANFVSNALKGITGRQPPYSAVVVVNAGRFAFTGISPGTMRPAAMQPRYDVYAEAVASATAQIAQVSPVLYVTPAPQASGGRFPSCVMPSILTSPRWGCAILDEEYLGQTLVPTRQALERRLGSSVTLYDPSSVLCQGGTCALAADGQFRYRDESHLTVAASDLFVADLQEQLRRTLDSDTVGPRG